MINSKVKVLAETYPTVSKSKTGYVIHKIKKTVLNRDSDAILVADMGNNCFIAQIDNNFITVGPADFE